MALQLPLSEVWKDGALGRRNLQKDIHCTHTHTDTHAPQYPPNAITEEEGGEGIVACQKEKVTSLPPQKKN